VRKSRIPPRPRARGPTTGSRNGTSRARFQAIWLSGFAKYARFKQQTGVRAKKPTPQNGPRHKRGAPWNERRRRVSGGCGRASTEVRVGRVGQPAGGGAGSAVAPRGARARPGPPRRNRAHHCTTRGLSALALINQRPAVSTWATPSTLRAVGAETLSPGTT
jgi:hypothetical protein